MSYVPMITGVVSGDNSTATPLSPTSSWIGTFEDVSGYSDVMISCKSDTSGSLRIEFSPDATNIDSTLSYNVASNLNEVHRVAVTRKWYRANFLNAATSSQTYLNVQSILGNHSLLSIPLNSNIQQDADAIMVRALDSEIDISSGKYTGFSIVNIFGENNDIDSGTVPEDVWPTGGTYTGFNLTSASPLIVSSSSVNDTAAGIGARTIELIGLDGNYNELRETIQLNGTTPVSGSSQFLRVNIAVVQSVGASEANVGSIFVGASSNSSIIFMNVPENLNQSNSSAYTVPFGKTAYMRRIHAHIRGQANVTSDGYVWTRKMNFPFRPQRPFTITSNAPLMDVIYGGIVLEEKTDIIIRITSCTSNNTDITAGYDLLLIDNY